MKVQWRKCKQTDDLDDAGKSRFYRVRANVVRAVQKQNVAATNNNASNKYLDNPPSAHKLELSPAEIDQLAREAYDSEMMPILHDNKILLTKAPVVGDMPC